MRIGAAYSVQFHAEVAEHTLSQWCTLEECVEALEEAFGPDGVAKTDARLVPVLPQIRATAHAINDRMMALCVARA